MTLQLLQTGSNSRSFAALAGLEQAALDALPQAIYLCARDGRLVRFNQKAVDLWGRRPRLGDPEERFCGSHRLYKADGELLPHEQCPMATALRTGASFQNQEVVIEQPSGRRRAVLANIATFKGEDGGVQGAVNCFQEIADGDRVERQQSLLIVRVKERIRRTLSIVLSLTPSRRRSEQTADLVHGIGPVLRALSQLRRAEWPTVSIAAQAAIIALCVGLALVIRLASGNFAPGSLPYATFFPAIALAALIGGARAGIGTWILSIIAGAFFVSAPMLVPNAVLFAFSSGVELLIALALRAALGRVVASEARHRAVANLAVDMIASFDAKGAWKEPCTRWERLTGLAWPGYAGEGWLNAVHENERTAARSATKNGIREPLQLRIWDCARSDWRWFSLRVVMLNGPDGSPCEVLCALADVTTQRSSDERRELLLGDMRHRLKNLMALVQAIVRSSAPRNEPAVAAFVEKLGGRLRSLETAGDLVMKSNAKDVDLAEVVPAALEPFISTYRDRLAIAGEPLLLQEHTVGGIALACHELATNAVKYGALSNEKGRISIRWHRCRSEDNCESVLVEWLEESGPPVSPPAREGFGTRIINAAVRGEPNGVVKLEYLPSGLRCRFAFSRPKQCEPEPAHCQ